MATLIASSNAGRPDDYGSPRTFASIASHTSAAMSAPPKRFTSRMPVGEVTLISVSQSPITSMPTKIRPRSLSVGPIAAQMSRSRAGHLDRLRPAADMHVGARLALRRHAVDDADRLALDEDDALVALAHLRQVALHHIGLAERSREQFEQRTEILVAPGKAEDPGAAIAVKRLYDDVAELLAELPDLLDVRVISVGGVSSGNSVTKSFSGAFRTLAGSLTTSIFGCSRSRMCVVVM